MNFRASMNAAKLFLRNNKSTILMAGGVILTICAVGEAIRATSKAKDIIDELEYEKFEDLGAPEEPNVDCRLDKKEVLRGVWKCYIWTGLLLSGAVTCCICSHVSSNKTIGAMSMAYASLLETYNTYQDNVRKIVREKDIRAIDHNVVHDIIQEDKKIIPESAQRKTFVISDETQICFRDAYSAKGTGYFKMTMNDARIAVSKFNKWLMDNEKASLNDWYDFIGLGHSELGDNLGWSWMEDGPLYLRAIPDDIDEDEDNIVITMIGLTSDEHAAYFKMPSNIY